MKLCLKVSQVTGIISRLQVTLENGLKYVEMADARESGV